MEIRPKWSYAAAMTRTRLPQFASLVPVLGYAVLWGNEFQDLVMRFDRTLGAGLWFDPLQRIYLLYSGSLLTLIGLVVFWIASPWQVRLHASRREYISAVGLDLDEKEAKMAAKLVDHATRVLRRNEDVVVYGVPVKPHLVSRAASGKFVDEVRPVFAAHYELLDRRWPWLSGAVFALRVGGAFVFLLPALEVLIAALGQMSSIFEAKPI